MTAPLRRQQKTYSLGDDSVAEFKLRMLSWSQQFSIHIFLDNNQYAKTAANYECLCAAGALKNLTGGGTDMLQELQQLHDARKDWFFGHITYDYKNILHPGLPPTRPGSSGFPLLHFFIPETVCYMASDCKTVTIATVHDPEVIFREILAVSVPAIDLPKLSFERLTDKDAYLATIATLRTHIADGDCYEINYCTKGFCENAIIDPVAAFRALNALSPAPFAAFYRVQESYLMCASPERYIRKEGARILSQPIKGTSRRDADQQKDNDLKNDLQTSIKERAENVMIVDLVRNDLARSCEVGSVQVDELFGIYTYPHVHQMISTVSGTLKQGVPFTDAIRHSFPMGSMTGAPKYKVMQLIDKYEDSARELFSGTVGYITPDGDFDFNVIIRSLFYNSATQYLSYQTGGAITYDSDAEQEWAEMRLKAWAVERIFS